MIFVRENTKEGFSRYSLRLIWCLFSFILIAFTTKFNDNDNDRNNDTDNNDNDEQR